MGRAWTRSGWFGWLRRRGARAEPEARAGRPDEAGGPLAAPVADPFAPFAEVLGVPSPAAAPPGDPGEEALAARVLEHFLAHRPDAASAPSLALQVLGLVSSPRSDLGEMVRLVSADPALSIGVLEVANSAAARGRDEVESVRAAVVRLGMNEVGWIAGALSAKSLFDAALRSERAAHGARFEALHRRAATVAFAAAGLVIRRRGGRVDRAFLGGMLHDVGRSIALRSAAALGVGADAPGLEGALERVHVEVGAECHRRWRLPGYLEVMASRHHDPELPAAPELVELHAVRLVGALLDVREAPLARRAAAEIVQSAGALGMGPLAVRSLDAEVRSAAARAASALGAAAGAPRRSVA
jgi:HD-like signal output (HDOD) protein